MNANLFSPFCLFCHLNILFTIGNFYKFNDRSLIVTMEVKGLPGNDTDNKQKLKKLFRLVPIARPFGPCGTNLKVAAEGQI